MLKESHRDPAQALDVHNILAGDYWLGRLSAGQVLRITDLELPPDAEAWAQALPETRDDD